MVFDQPGIRSRLRKSEINTVPDRIPLRPLQNNNSSFVVVHMCVFLFVPVKIITFNAMFESLKRIFL